MATVGLWEEESGLGRDEAPGGGWEPKTTPRDGASEPGCSAQQKEELWNLSRWGGAPLEKEGLCTFGPSLGNAPPRWPHPAGPELGLGKQCLLLL